MEQGIVIKKVLSVLKLPQLSAWLKKGGHSVSAYLKMLMNWGLYPFFSKKNAFFCTHFTILGLLAKVDGDINYEEQKFFDNYMDKLKFNDKKFQRSKKLFEGANSQKGNFNSHITRMTILAKGDAKVLIPFFDTLNDMALCDGFLTEEEQNLLIGTLKKFGLDHYQAGSRDPYRILEARENYTSDQIKRCYRQKMSEFHPDKLLALRLPTEFKVFTEARFQEIQTAYEEIRKRCGF